MSHFTVLVIGDDPEQQLAPYHEFECTGRNDQWVQDIDITQEFLQIMADSDDEDPLLDALGYWGLEDSVVGDEAQVDRDGMHKHGYAVITQNPAGTPCIIRVVNRTNPNKKWDWYSVGGRWTGFFTLKPGASGSTGSPGIFGNRAEPNTADQARKGAIDWEAMRSKAGDAAAQQWDRVREVAPELWQSWDTVRSEFPEDPEQARRVYHDQAGRRALWASVDDTIRWLEDDVLVDRDRYIRRARAQSGATFAVVRDGNWYERGSMGWWGVVSNEQDRDTWAEQVASMIDALPEDTLITLVDCHI